jgi:hypothetical protein
VFGKGGRGGEDEWVWSRGSWWRHGDSHWLRRRYNHCWRRYVFSTQMRSPVSFGADELLTIADTATHDSKTAAPSGCAIPALDSTLFKAGEVGFKLRRKVPCGM